MLLSIFYLKWLKNGHCEQCVVKSFTTIWRRCNRQVELLFHNNRLTSHIFNYYWMEVQICCQSVEILMETNVVFSFVSSSIQCWFPDNYRSSWEQYASDFCQAHNTFVLPSHFDTISKGPTSFYIVNIERLNVTTIPDSNVISEAINRNLEVFRNVATLQSITNGFHSYSYSRLFFFICQYLCGENCTWA
jgi:hypothetical protein